EFDQELSQPAPLPSAFTGGLRLSETGPVHGLGRLVIPKIGVNVIIVQGVTLDRLAYGPGHYPSTKLFGDKGVTAVAGHRTGWGAPFFNFDRLKVGDTVMVQTLKATYTYQIRNEIVVSPSHSEVLDGNPNSTADQQLILTTCTPK